jgi:hypothetical protein
VSKVSNGHGSHDELFCARFKDVLISSALQDAWERILEADAIDHAGWGA